MIFERHTRTSAKRSIAIAAIAATLIASCSSGEGPTLEGSATTAAPSPTTSAAATTTTTSTTSTSTTTTTTTEPGPTISVIEDDTSDATSTTSAPLPDPEVPVTTQFDPDTIEGQIEQVILADNEAYKTCLRELPDCDVAAATRFGEAEYVLGRTNRYEGFNQDGWTVDRVDSVQAQITEISLLDPPVEAFVTVCFESGARFTAPDPAGEVFDDFVSQVRNYLVANVGGPNWLVAGFETLESADGEENSLCS